MPKNLFDDDEPEQFQVAVNSGYAKKFDQVKRKQELQTLTAKHGAAASSSDDDSEVEDDDAEMLTEEKEAEFAAVISAIFSKDDAVLQDKTRTFFAERPVDAAPAAKPFTLKEEYQRAITAPGGGKDYAGEAAPVDAAAASGKTSKIVPKTALEAKAREAFLAATETASIEVKKKSTAPAPAAAGGDSRPTSKRVLDSAFQLRLDGTKAVGEERVNEEFLRSFFVNELWKPTEEQKGQAGYSWDELAADEQDEMFFDDAEQWEKEFQDKQFRHEADLDTLQVQSFPRKQEGVLRQKPATRREQRERKDQRLHEAQVRQVEELKRLKTLKRQEIDEQRRIIEEVSGMARGKQQQQSGAKAAAASSAGKPSLGKLTPEQLKELLQGDFDSKTFDAQMTALFDDEYDANVDEAEVEAMENELDLGVDEEEGDSDEGDDDDGQRANDDEDDDGFAATYEEEMKKAKSTKSKKAAAAAAHHDSFLVDDDFAMLYPAQAIRQMEAAPPTNHAPAMPLADDETHAEKLSKLQTTLESKVDEYWKLHYHRVAGGVRTRFKYRAVHAETFGLTDVDVLGKDDRQLNMIAPLNCYAAYLGKEENMADRFKALHRVKNVRVIDPTRSSRRYGNDVGKTQVFGADFTAEAAAEVSKRLREGPLAADAAGSAAPQDGDRGSAKKKRRK